MTEFSERLKERRLAKMRMGQAAAEILEIPSDPESRLGIVPLTEAEYEECLSAAANAGGLDNSHGAEFRDRVQTSEILTRACRVPGSTDKRAFDTREELVEVLEPPDVNFFIDAYLELTDKTSPKIDGVSEEFLDGLKKALQEIDLNELSGRQWYAAKRFLMAIMPELLQGKLHGFSSTKLSTTTSDDPASTSNVSKSGSETIAKSAESLAASE